MAPVAVISGGSRRIGLAISQRLAAAGHDLLLVYRQDEAAAAAAQESLAASGVRVHTVRADLAHRAAAERVVRETLEQFGRIDLLVNSAGPFVPGSFLESTPEAYDLMVGGNLHAVVYLTQAVLPTMRAQGAGQIINLGSLNAEAARGAPNAAIYHALKSAVVVLTRSIARSEGPHGIRANVVNPGMVHTLGAAEGIEQRIPLRRLGRADEVAAAVAWLASEEAGYVSGSVLNVNGGLWV